MPDLLTDCGQMWAWKQIIAYALRRGENSELTMDTDAWHYLPGADVQHREWTNMGRSFLSSVSELVFGSRELWTCTCNMLTAWKNLLLSSFFHTKKKTHKSGVSNSSLLKHHLNNLLNFHHFALTAAFLPLSPILLPRQRAFGLVPSTAQATHLRDGNRQSKQWSKAVYKAFNTSGREKSPSFHVKAKTDQNDAKHMENMENVE